MTSWGYREGSIRNTLNDTGAVCLVAHCPNVPEIPDQEREQHAAEVSVGGHCDPVGGNVYAAKASPSTREPILHRSIRRQHHTRRHHSVRKRVGGRRQQSEFSCRTQSGIPTGIPTSGWQQTGRRANLHLWERQRQPLNICEFHADHLHHQRQIRPERNDFA